MKWVTRVITLVSIVAVFNFNVPIVHAALLTSIVAYYKLDESGTGTRADSVAGNTLQNPGSLNSGTGLINNALVLASTNTASTTSVWTAATTNVSYNMWINTTGDSGTGAFFHNGSDVGSGNGLAICISAAGGNCASGNRLTVWSPGVAFDNCGTDVGSSGFHMITITRDASTIRCYIDGTITASTIATTPLAATVQSRIGGGQGNFWTGNIDEVGIWNQQLSQADITALYKNGLGNQYPFPAFTYSQLFDDF